MPFRSSQLERGFVVGGYRIDELISRGGMGVVYRATNVALNRIYALKVLAPELSDDDQFRERFKREMRVAASLHHPNVVGIHYAGEHDGLLFLVMDFIHGTDLRQLLQKSGALEPERAVDLLAQLASALDAAHAKGLVHRDVKPGNVLITVREGEEHAFLTDFGLAKRSDTVGGLTKKGVVVGTVDYMSPEQVTGGTTDARTDIYALGCVFFQMLTGKVPYERENSIATLFAHVHEPPPPLEAALADSYPDFGPVVDKAMAKEPAYRYLSAGDFARAAAAALRGMRYTAPPSVVATGDAKPQTGADPGPPPRSGSETWFTAEPEVARGAEPEPSDTAQPEVVPSPEPEPQYTAQPQAVPSPEPEPHYTAQAEVVHSAHSEPVSSPEPSAPAAPTRRGVPPPYVPDEIAATGDGEPTAAPGAPTRIVASVDGAAAATSGSLAAATSGSLAAAAAGSPAAGSPTAGSPTAGPTGSRTQPPAGSPAGPPTRSPAWSPAGSPAGPPTGSPAGPPARPPTGVVASGAPHPPERRVRRYRWLALAAALLVGAGVAAVIVLSSSGSSSKATVGQRLTAATSPVPTNRVTGSGSATVILNGDVATVTLTTVGLLNGWPHLIHIHAGGEGICPPASAARLHNGHLAISTGNGIRFYGPPLVSLTLRGDTSARSNLAFSRFPSVGAISYKRTVTVSPAIASLIREGNGVVVVHGIDYDGSGSYDDVLGQSDLARQFTGDSTAPALCGHLAASQATASAPRKARAILAASLTPYTPSQSEQAAAFLLSCHLSGSALTTTDAPPAGGID
jgi:serine/threonine protein kinase